MAIPFSRRALLAGAVAIPASAAAANVPGAADELVLNDASGLNPTRVARHIVLRPAPGERMIARLRAALADATREGRPLVMGGARHSMGGQSLCAEAVALTAEGDGCVADPAGRTYRAEAGARWRTIVPALDRIGLSVAVMQSNSDFSVGGTLSVNGHGWAVPFGSFASTVRSFRLLLADGDLVICSASENPDLFRAAIGGYGLLGVVVDAELDAVPNCALRPTLVTMAADRFASVFAGAIGTDPDLRMAYGRLSVAPGSFLKEAVAVTFRELRGAGPLPPADDAGLVAFMSRTMLRAQTGSDLGKELRWWAETTLAPRLAPEAVTRNRLLGQPVASLGTSGGGRTDILHEYFLPPDRLEEFLAGCRSAIPGSGLDLLNVTLRYLAPDRTSLMSFVPAARIAAVMLFSQARTLAADTAMRRTTERLIDHALACGGSFYLPYRLHARRDQVARAYPGLDAFLALKRRHDPAGLFRNRMWEAYWA